MPGADIEMDLFMEMHLKLLMWIFHQVHVDNIRL